jgi:hypothetical protein
MTHVCTGDTSVVPKCSNAHPLAIDVHQHKARPHIMRDAAQKKQIAGASREVNMKALETLTS